MVWYNSSWNYRVKLTIQNGKVDADLTDFPVYVDLSELPSEFHTNVNQTDARDIRVTKSDGSTELPREIVFYDSTTDTGELHFKYTGTLSSSSNTDIYVYYGNSGASDYARDATYGLENVWNINYKLVMHLQEVANDNIGGYSDSTSNINHGQGNSMLISASSGQLSENSAEFDGISDYIQVLSDTSLDSISTVSLWFNSDGGTQEAIIGQNNTDSDRWLMLGKYGTDNSPILWSNDHGIMIASDTDNNGDATWHKSAIVWDGTNAKLYVDNVSQGTPTLNNPFDEGAGGGIDIGTYFYTGTSQGPYDGKIDEIRISSVELTEEWNTTEYNNQSDTTTFFAVGTQERNWYDNNWNYRVKLTVQNTKVDADLTDFPVYVDLSDLPTGFHTNVNQTDARDIRVTKSDGTELAREVVSYNSTTDTGELHLKYIGTLSSSTDTDIYIYYGNSGASDYGVTDTYGRNAVWSDYESVWHLQETSGTIIDSSGNHNSASETITSYSSTGKLNDCVDVSGSSDVIEFGDVLDIGLNDFTISHWIKTTQTLSSGASGFSVSKSKAAAQDFRYGTGIRNDGVSTRARLFIQGDGGADVSVVGTTVVNDGNWYKTDLVFDRSASASVYVNGSSENSAVISQWSAANFNSDNPFRLASYTASDNVGLSSVYSGDLEEVRIIFSVLSSTWLSTEHNNQSDTSTFFSVGTQETGISNSTIIGLSTMIGIQSITM